MLSACTSLSLKGEIFERSDIGQKLSNSKMESVGLK